MVMVYYLRQSHTLSHETCLTQTMTTSLRYGVILGCGICVPVSPSVNPSDICCFQDVHLERLNTISRVSIADSFFSPGFLEFLEEFSVSVNDHVIDNVEGFPG